ncbi:hypothetical protein CC80DRAFT_576556 [Byssothecium circinans]|uniref:Uncharacterized protein n=1 Tax=Byssothecium circinans TaxID=147558 RepID=A0A6A5TPH0_9PLEO|nr:hypothetical protein CC80DRAFT_576556 [Byssothecium circinans]
MCIYYRKLHTCTCLSRILLQRCIPAIHTNTVCDPSSIPTPSEDPTDGTHQKSHFACYDCLRGEAIREIEAAHAAAAVTANSQPSLGNGNTAAAPTTSVPQRDMARLAYKRVKSENARKAAEERARREKGEDEARKKKMMEERERAGTEGAGWIDVGSARKGKGRSRGVVPSFSGVGMARTGMSAGVGFQGQGVSVGAGFGGGFGGGGVGSGSGRGYNKMGEFGRREEGGRPAAGGGVGGGGGGGNHGGPRGMGSWRSGAGAASSNPKTILQNVERKSGTTTTTANGKDVAQGALASTTTSTSTLVPPIIPS